MQRAIAARCNYMSLDMPDLHFAVRDARLETARPTQGSLANGVPGDCSIRRQGRGLYCDSGGELM